MARAIADQFAEALALAGVRRIYGIVGDTLNGLTDALAKERSTGSTSGTRRWPPSRPVRKRTSRVNWRCAPGAAARDS